jgi:hypothetical protein
MTFLVGSSVWLELLFDQNRAEEVHRFLETTPMAELAISEFSVYSIGIALVRNSLDDAFVQFVSDSLEGTALNRLRLETTNLKGIVAARKQCGKARPDNSQLRCPFRPDQTGPDDAGRSGQATREMTVCVVRLPKVTRTPSSNCRFREEKHQDERACCPNGTCWRWVTRNRCGGNFNSLCALNK